jgi:hypothetical protein
MMKDGAAAHRTCFVLWPGVRLLTPCSRSSWRSSLKADPDQEQAADRLEEWDVEQHGS